MAFKKYDCLLTGQGGFGADVNETAGTGPLGSAEHMPGALHVDMIPGVRMSPLLDEGGAVDHDVGAPDIRSDQCIEIALDRFRADRANLLITGR